MWENVNFISVIPKDKDYHLIKGSGIPNWKAEYKEALIKDYVQAIPMQEKVMRMSFSSQYERDGTYTLNIYYPLYSSKVMDRQLGVLCVNVDDANLSQLLSSGDEEMAVDNYFVHKDGIIISSTDNSKIGTKFMEMPLDGKQKTTMTPGNLIIYKKLSNWDFYYVTRISWWELLSDSVRNVVTLTFLLVLMLIITVRLAHSLVTKAYEPWGKVVRAMSQVSQGALKTRLPAEETDPDMEVVAQGFNSMMSQLVKSMDQIKEEQYQMDQIRMEALQSQIQPHFLYNTLDCIHWQAVISGNQDISKLVKALASYYRTCLSRGKDIITLKEELTYTKNYL
jgi:two-component system sensor histidine kinase YesM